MNITLSGGVGISCDRQPHDRQHGMAGWQSPAARGLRWRPRASPARTALHKEARRQRHQLGDGGSGQYELADCYWSLFDPLAAASECDGLRNQRSLARADAGNMGAALTSGTACSPEVCRSGGSTVGHRRSIALDGRSHSMRQSRGGSVPSAA
ncbi:MAG: hypothetical protein AW07_00563 [Candidatus Accumulibacter sp. SK-11]|nr:MAG: hypothetical protein AW07_00563 [Candidatus Accumulibacter sp. SK-11]